MSVKPGEVQKDQILKKDDPTRLRLEAVLHLIDITVESLFKAYYSYLDEPPEGVLITSDFWKRNDECLVFGPAFLIELRNILENRVIIDDNFKNFFLKSFKCLLISYWDANGIKEINDRLSSHATGNETIRSVGRWISEGFKHITTEIIKNHGDHKKLRFWVIRWGGDEFIVVLASDSQIKDNQREDIRELLRDKIDECVIGSKQLFIKNLCDWRTFLCKRRTDKEMEEVLNHVGISGGWSWYTDNFESARDEAERAMYVAKAVAKQPLSSRCGCIGLEFHKDFHEFAQFLKNIAQSEKIPDRLRLSQ